MNQVNACYVLRGHLLTKAINCAEQGGFSEFHRWFTLVQNPFEAYIP
jgi:uncharacterized protein YdiU (UPF0061 family)